MENTTARTSPLSLAIAWLIVGVPLLWGVMETFKKSLALFH
ncbi:MAG TPA: hypothetical protein VFE90_12150 [Myxococcales bacterium]|jgi:hypothetical protein|nr:hypothetical protein [Myxococcales bacterium]